MEVRSKWVVVVDGHVHTGCRHADSLDHDFPLAELTMAVAVSGGRVDLYSQI